MGAFQIKAIGFCVFEQALSGKGGKEVDWGEQIAHDRYYAALLIIPKHKGSFWAEYNKQAQKHTSKHEKLNKNHQALKMNRLRKCLHKLFYNSGKSFLQI